MSATTAGLVATVPTVSIGGRDLSADWLDALVDLRVALEFRVPGRAVLRFADPGYALTESGRAQLGAAVVVGALRPDATEPDVLLAGEVTGVTVEQSATDDPELVLVVHDRAYRLTRATLVGTYVNSSIDVVVTTIAQRHGLRADVTAPRATLDYLLQVDSDLALLDALADRTGHDWWVDDTTLHFRPPGSGERPRTVVDLVLGRNLTQFAVRASGLHPDAVTVDGWDRRAQQAVTATAPTAAASVGTDSAMFEPFVAPGPKLGGRAPLVAAGLHARTQDEAKQVAASLGARLAAAAVTATGTALHGSRLLPGVRALVKSAGPTSGTYHVTKVEHVYRNAFESRFTAGERTPASLVDLLDGAGRGSPLRHHGLVVGEVTNVNDDARSGRVKVRYPGLAPDEESAWARVVALGGGSGRGLVVLPEVGDEVLVGFEGGDLRQPVVLGGLFGDKRAIPLWDVAEGAVSGRRFTSRLGHVVELKDGSAPADQHVLLQLAGAKHRVRLGKDRCDIAVPSGVPFSIKVGDNASLVFDAAGSLTIKAVNVTIEAEGSFKTSSKATTTIESASALTVEGRMTNVKGTTVQVEGSGPVRVKGMPVAIN